MLRRTVLILSGVALAACASDPPTPPSVGTSGTGESDSFAGSSTSTTTGDANTSSTGSASADGSEDANDSAGSTGSSVDETPPVIESFEFDGSAEPPLVDTVGRYELRAVVSDDVAVERVEFWIDAALAQTVSEADGDVYTTQWLISGAVEFNGPHALEVRAFDEAGNEAEAGPITLSVELPETGGTRWQESLRPVPGELIALGLYEARDVALVGSEHLVVVGETADGDAAIVRRTRAGAVASWDAPFFDGGNRDGANAIVLTPEGDPLVVGYSEQAVPMLEGLHRHLWVQRYDDAGATGAGGTLNIAGSDQPSEGVDVAIDGTGNRYLAIRSGSNAGYFAKFDPEGAQLWVRQTTFVPQGIAPAADGDFFATGYDAGQIFVGRFDPEGDERWSRTTGTRSGFSSGRAVLELATGEVVVVGEIGAAGGRNGWARAYDALGRSIAWTLVYDFMENEALYDVAPGPRGELWVVGQSQDVCESLCISPDTDTLIAKISPEGTKVFEQLLDLGQQDWAAAVAVDELGVPYVVGSVGNTADPDLQWWIGSFHP